MPRRRRAARGATRARRRWGAPTPGRRPLDAAQARTRASWRGCRRCGGGQREAGRSRHATARVRVVDELGAERSPEEYVARDVIGPCFAERAGEGEEHRARRERRRRSRPPDAIAARVDDQRVRRQYGLDLLEQERPFIALPYEPRRRRLQNERRPFHLGHERWDPGGFGRGRRACEGVARRARAQPAERDAGDDEVERGTRRRRKHRHVEIGDSALGGVELSGKNKPTCSKMSRVSGIHDVAVARKRRVRRLERLDRPAKVARDERDLSLGDDAARAGHRLAGSEGLRGTPEQRAGTLEIAELRHGDPAQRERRGVVAQRHAVQRAERIAGRERAGGGEDHRVHGIPSHLLLTPATSRGVIYRSYTRRNR